MIRSGGAITAVLLLSVGLLSGCSADKPAQTQRFSSAESSDASGEHGLASQSGAEISDRVIGAVRASTSVRFSGTYSLPAPKDESVGPGLEGSESRTLSFDASGSAEKMRLEVKMGDRVGALVVTEAYVFASGNSAFMTALGVLAPTEEPVRFPSDADPLEPWLVFARADRLLASVIKTNPANPELSISGMSDGGAPRTQVAISAGGALLGTLEVDAEGPALPREMAITDGSGQLKVSFNEWGTAAVPDLPRHWGNPDGSSANG
ncbi:hypothetical protein M2390_001873 [Mycetocola sp. BIGb0189]|uniref:hypothetical protein n=1 Tax=Mycetocola sp. BIGb0189 TaxID=2940604 RepID=UPI002167DC15|nr:hypothetical protein [Mycetocola sp. BIGb0189]MCS4276679.1 hypothetical protein [Mycetocola sp. BIGb0189]